MGTKLLVRAAAPLLALFVLAACDYGSASDTTYGRAGSDPDATSNATVVRGQGGAPFTVELTGAAEAPGPGDPDGSGTARLTFNYGQRRVCYAIEVFDVGTITAAHIHVAPVGEPGPVVVPLPPTPDDPTPDEFSGCTDDVDRDLIRAMRENPGNYYVNVHNAEYPAGALRGQLGS